MIKYNVVDLFAGIGGLSYGFSVLPEFKILIANELEEQISKAYTLNHPDVKMFNCDINELTENTLLSCLGDRKIDVLVGGPPCQSYSTLGKRQMDERANLFLQYKRILQVLTPKIFVYENVVGLLSMNKGKLFKQIQKEFASLGYTIKYKVLNAVDYGVPQYRERIILVGMKGENTFEYPQPTHGEGLKPYITLKDALGDLPVIKSGESNDTYACGVYNEYLEFVRNNGEYLTEHMSPKNGEHLIRIMEALKDGQSKDDLPENIRPTSGYGNTYAKLWWEKPATTITRNFACPSSSRCIHPRDSRALSVREGARLQSFPDNYKLPESNTYKRLALGNAVPPLLSMSIAKQVLIVLNELRQ